MLLEEIQAILKTQKMNGKLLMNLPQNLQNRPLTTASKYTYQMINDKESSVTILAFDWLILTL